MLVKWICTFVCMTMENEKIVRKIVRVGQKPTEAQIDEIEKAASMPIIIDDEAPELTLEQYAEMAAIAKERKAKNIKPVIALRISPETLEKAKATGKGYTGFLSRLLACNRRENRPRRWLLYDCSQ